MFGSPVGGKILGDSVLANFRNVVWFDAALLGGVSVIHLSCLSLQNHPMICGTSNFSLSHADIEYAGDFMCSRGKVVGRGRQESLEMEGVSFA